MSPHADGGRIKVLYLIETLGVGGAERSLLQLLPRLTSVSPTICHLYDGDDLRADFERAGVRVESLGVPPKYNFATAIRRVDALVRRERPALIHTTLFRAEVVGRIVGRLHGIPVVCSIVSECYGEARMRMLTLAGRAKLRGIQALDRLTAPLATHFVANSQAVKDSETRSLGVDPDRVTVVHRGRDPGPFTEPRPGRDAGHRAALGLPASAPVVLSVGRLVDSKGQAELVDAFRTVAARLPGAMLLLAGDGPERENLQRRIDGAGLGKSVRLLGRRDDIPDLLALADLFVFPSHYEGHPGAVVEAMFAGLPIVLSDIPVHRETVGSDEAGLLVPIRSPAALAEAIVTLLRDREGARAMGARARAAAVARYHIDATVTRYEALYDRVLAGRDPAPARPRKKRILHCVYSGLGGHAAVLFTLLETRVRQRYDHFVLFFGVEELREEYARSCSALGVPYAFVRKRGRAAIGSHAAVLRTIRRTRPDVVMINGSPLAVPLLGARWLLRQRWASVVRETQANHLKTRGEWLGSWMAARLADAVVYLTDEYAAEVRARLGATARAGRAHVIPNGVDTDLFRPGPGSAAGRIRLAMVSRVNPIKDHATLVEAVRRLVRERGRTDVELLVAGDGPSRPELEARVAADGLGEHVRFAGVVTADEIATLLAGTDVYVHCTLGETMSNSILQAMAAGLPVVASDVRGVSNLLRDGEDGLLVPARDPESLADAIEALASSPSLRREMGAAARARVEETLSRHRMVTRYDELFQSLTRPDGVRSPAVATGVSSSVVRA